MSSTHVDDRNILHLGYIANKDKIKNPNNLVPGTDLIIPELTEQEMRITKDQGLVLYGNARQER